MQVDHRRPYPGDNDIRFEPRDDTPEMQKRLARVKVRKPQRREPNDLDRRVQAVFHRIPFKDHRERFLFLRNVRRTETFEELTALSQRLILAAEAATPDRTSSAVPAGEAEDGLVGGQGCSEPADRAGSGTAK
jgi:hypothetical protein